MSDANEQQGLDAFSKRYLAALAIIALPAAALVMAQADVGRVRWVLDEQWLSGHGIDVQ